MSMRAPRTTGRSRTSSARATPTTPISPNMACATGGARDARRRARRRCALPPAPSRAKSCPRCACAARSSRSARTKSIAPIGGGTRSSNNPFFCPDRRGGGGLGQVSRRGAQGGLIDRRHHRGRRRRRAGRARRADLRQARPGHRERADEHQRGQGRRDRRRLRRGRHVGRGECRRDAQPADGWPMFKSNNAGGILGGISTGQPIVARFAVKPTSSILTPRETVDTQGQRDRGLDQGPPRPVRRHPRRADRRGDGGHRARRPLPPPSRPERVRPAAWARLLDHCLRRACLMAGTDALAH